MVNLLRVALEDSVDPAVRQVAAISFKNLVKRDWAAEGAQGRSGVAVAWVGEGKRAGWARQQRRRNATAAALLLPFCCCSLPCQLTAASAHRAGAKCRGQAVAAG